MDQHDKKDSNNNGKPSSGSKRSRKNNGNINKEMMSDSGINLRAKWGML